MAPVEFLGFPWVCFLGSRLFSVLKGIHIKKTYLNGTGSQTLCEAKEARYKCLPIASIRRKNLEV